MLYQFNWSSIGYLQLISLFLHFWPISSADILYNQTNKFLNCFIYIPLWMYPIKDKYIFKELYNRIPFSLKLRQESSHDGSQANSSSSLHHTLLHLYQSQDGNGYPFLIHNHLTENKSSISHSNNKDFFKIIKINIMAIVSTYCGTEVFCNNDDNGLT